MLSARLEELRVGVIVSSFPLSSPLSPLLFAADEDGDDNSPITVFFSSLARLTSLFGGNKSIKTVIDTRGDTKTINKLIYRYS